MPRIQLVVNDEQRDRWDEYVADNPATDSMSDLIWTAVEEFIATVEDSASPELNDAVVDAHLFSDKRTEPDNGFVRSIQDARFDVCHVYEDADWGYKSHPRSRVGSNYASSP